MAIKIRLVENEEDWIISKQMTTYAFAPSPTGKDIDTSRFEYTRDNRIYILSDDEIDNSTLDAIPMTQNVRGKLFEMQGIAGVATYPEARNKGYIRKLMIHALREARKDGQIFSTLYPFRQSFYANFGYITFPQARELIINPVNMISRNIEGRIERYEIKDCIDRYYSYMLRYQQAHHGIAMFSRTNVQRHEKSNMWVIFAIIDDVDSGMMIFSTKGFEREMVVNTFMHDNSQAKYILLQHLASHRDQFKEIKMRVLAYDTPENWAYDLKAVIRSRDWIPSAMGRIVDIAGLSGIEVGDGQINISIVDEYCDWNTGIWKFCAVDNKLEVSKQIQQILNLQSMEYQQLYLVDMNCMILNSELGEK